MIMCVYPYFVTNNYQDRALHNEDKQKCMLDFMNMDPQERALACLRYKEEKIHNVTKIRRIKLYDELYFKGSAITNVFIPPNSDQEHIVQRIIAAKPDGKQLTTLKLVSHGDSGRLCLSGVQAILLDHGNADAWGALRPHFCRPSSVIHLHGCGVASDTSIVAGGTPDNPNTVPGQWVGGTGLGYALMSRLAYVTGVPVQAALDDVTYLYTTASDNNRPQDPFKGKTVYVTPDGDAWLSWEQKWVRPPKPAWEKVFGRPKL
jgi:hypothetical protein